MKALIALLVALALIGCASRSDIDRLEARIDRAEEQIGAARTAFEVAGNSLQTLNQRTSAQETRLTNLERATPPDDFSIIEDWLLEFDYRILVLEEIAVDHEKRFITASEIMLPMIAWFENTAEWIERAEKSFEVIWLNLGNRR